MPFCSCPEKANYYQLVKASVLDSELVPLKPHGLERHAGCGVEIPHFQGFYRCSRREFGCMHHDSAAAGGCSTRPVIILVSVVCRQTVQQLWSGRRRLSSVAALPNHAMGDQACERGRGGTGDGLFPSMGARSRTAQDCRPAPFTVETLYKPWGHAKENRVPAA